MSKRRMFVTATTLTFVLGASTARAALTTASCLAQKQKAWGGLRKCEAGEKAKLILGKTADPAKCTTKFQKNLTKLNEKARKAALACRYRDNGDGTVTDYDTGLQWEQKTDDASVHDKDNTYSWSDGGGGYTQPDGRTFKVFLGTLNNGTASDTTATSACFAGHCDSLLAAPKPALTASATSGCFAGHCDWRLPAIEELAGIVDATQGNCGAGSGPCIDQTVFGPTVAQAHLSASTHATFPDQAWGVDFADGVVHYFSKNLGYYVRGVRSVL